MNIIREASNHFEARKEINNSTYSIIECKSGRIICYAVGDARKYTAINFADRSEFTAFELMALGSLIGLLNESFQH